MTTHSEKRPTVWCVGGVDSSGGAGITRDAITLADLDVHACAITTQITVQSNTMMVNSVPVRASILNEQWQVLEHEGTPAAIKIGAIANDEQALLLCTRIQSMQTPRPFVVWDPVLRTSTGAMLTDLSENTISTLVSTVDLVTPNTDELCELTGLSVNSTETLQAAAHALLEGGANAILVKGGHAQWQDTVNDYFITSGYFRVFQQPRNANGRLRGTGCMLSSALCAFVVNGYDIDDALTLANAYVMHVREKSVSSLYPASMCSTSLSNTARPSNTVNLSNSTHLARTNGFPEQSALFPAVFTSCAEYQHFQQQRCGNHENCKINTAPFASLTNENMGIYPVVDSVDWIKMLLPTGVKIIQLRVKEGSPQYIADQIKEAVSITQNTQCQLFINDYWELAIEFGAYGVHLGQEDLDKADLKAIQKAGLRLGLSTHGYAEIQRIKALQPSYIALGHIFPTTTKSMPSQPQGIKRLAQYVALCKPTPTVAIGGIDFDSIRDVAATGVNSIAMVTAITRAEKPVSAFKLLSKEAGFAN